MFYIVSATKQEYDNIEDGGYFEAGSRDELHDTIDAMIDNGARKIAVSVEDYNTEGYDNSYED